MNSKIKTFTQNNKYDYGLDKEQTFWQKENGVWMVMFEKKDLKKKTPKGEAIILEEKNGFYWGVDEDGNLWKRFLNYEWREMKNKTSKMTTIKKSKLIAVKGMKYWLQDKDGTVRQRETDIPLNLWHKKVHDPNFYKMIYNKHYLMNYY